MCIYQNSFSHAQPNLEPNQYLIFAEINQKSFMIRYRFL